MKEIVDTCGMHATRAYPSFPYIGVDLDRLLPSMVYNGSLHPANPMIDSLTRSEVAADVLSFVELYIPLAYLIYRP